MSAICRITSHRRLAEDTDTVIRQCAHETSDYRPNMPMHIRHSRSIHHVEGAAKAVELELTDEEMAYLEEAYVPHKLVGVMAQNTPAQARKEHVCTTGTQSIEGR